MNYRSLGNTGIEIGEISLGSVPLNDNERGFEVSQETINSVVRKAVDYGVNFMDLTATSPVVRDKMAAAVRGVRDKLMISCHYGATWKEDAVFKTRNPELAKTSFEDLLSRLGTRHVDILFFSWIDNEDDFDAAFDDGGYLDFALKLKKEGKARVVALSTHRVLIAERAISTGYIDAIMFPVNPAHDMLPADFDIFEHETGDAQCMTN